MHGRLSFWLLVAFTISTLANGDNGGNLGDESGTLSLQSKVYNRPKQAMWIAVDVSLIKWLSSQAEKANLHSAAKAAEYKAAAQALNRAHLGLSLPNNQYAKHAPGLESKLSAAKKATLEEAKNFKQLEDGVQQWSRAQKQLSALEEARAKAYKLVRETGERVKSTNASLIAAEAGAKRMNAIRNIGEVALLVDIGGHVIAFLHNSDTPVILGGARFIVGEREEESIPHRPRTEERRQQIQNLPRKGAKEKDAVRFNPKDSHR